MFDFSNIQLVQPWWLLALLVIPVGIWWTYRNQRKREVSLLVPSLDAISHASWRGNLRKVLPILRLIAFAFIVLALTRPQNVLEEQEVKAEGIDIMLAMDLSSSMLARDFEPDRLTVSKEVAAEFVEKREFDRIGLSVFAGEAFTQCPLTTDHQVVTGYISELECGFLQDGTAIGMGLAAAINRLKDSDAKSKVVILLTDGKNTSGYIQPLTAAELAEEFGIKVYTIGVGSTGKALAPVSRRSNGEYIFGLSQVTIDEQLLREIAQMTNGKYFRATSREALEGIYDEIDQLEKTEMEVTAIKTYQETFHPLILLALALLVFELILRYGILRTVPL